MEFSIAFSNCARNVFLSYDEDSSASNLVRGLLLNNNNVFNKYLITKVSGDEIEIPLMAREHIEQIISESTFIYSGVIDAQTIILPLYENSTPQERRTFDSFIRQFFNNVSYGKRLQKVISSKGEVYYGGKGLILDDRYNPLMLCTLKAKKVQTANGTFRLEYFKPIIHVSPIVLTEPNKLVNRGIIKKIIPYYTVNKIPFPDSRHTVFYNDPVSRRGKEATVVIDNFDRFFVKPTVPKPQSCITESLNECLADNIDDILAMI